MPKRINEENTGIIELAKIRSSEKKISFEEIERTASVLELERRRETKQIEVRASQNISELLKKIGFSNIKVDKLDLSSIYAKENFVNQLELINTYYENSKDLKNILELDNITEIKPFINALHSLISNIVTKVDNDNKYLVLGGNKPKNVATKLDEVLGNVYTILTNKDHHGNYSRVDLINAAAAIAKNNLDFPLNAPLLKLKQDQQRRQSPQPVLENNGSESNQLRDVTVIKIIAESFKKQNPDNSNLQFVEFSHALALKHPELYAQGSSEFIKYFKDNYVKEGSYPTLYLFTNNDKRVFVWSDGGGFNAVCQEYNQENTWEETFSDVLRQHNPFIDHNGSCGVGAAIIATCYLSNGKSFLDEIVAKKDQNTYFSSHSTDFFLGEELKKYINTVSAENRAILETALDPFNMPTNSLFKDIIEDDITTSAGKDDNTIVFTKKDKTVELKVSDFIKLASEHNASFDKKENNNRKQKQPEEDVVRIHTGTPTAVALSGADIAAAVQVSQIAKKEIFDKEGNNNSIAVIDYKPDSDRIGGVDDQLKDKIETTNKKPYSTILDPIRNREGDIIGYSILTFGALLKKEGKKTDIYCGVNNFELYKEDNKILNTPPTFQKEDGESTHEDYVALQYMKDDKGTFKATLRYIHGKHDVQVCLPLPIGKDGQEENLIITIGAKGKDKISYNILKGSNLVPANAAQQAEINKVLDLNLHKISLEEREGGHSNYKANFNNSEEIELTDYLQIDSNQTESEAESEGEGLEQTKFGAESEGENSDPQNQPAPLSADKLIAASLPLASIKRKGKGEHKQREERRRNSKSQEETGRGFI